MMLDRSRRRRALSRSYATALTGLSVLLGACTDVATQPGTASSSSIETHALMTPAFRVARPEEAELLRLSRALPEFGGLYLDSTRTLVVSLTDLSKTEQAATLASPLLALLRARNPSRVANGVGFRQAKYRFEQLSEMRERMAMAVLSLDGVVFVDLDEVRNRLVVGVRRLTEAPRVAAVLSSSGIPSGAVEIELSGIADGHEAPWPARGRAPESAPSVATPTLQDEVSPKGGGLRVEQTHFGNPIKCTFGFSAKTAAAAQVFVTASNCTNTVWGFDVADFYQPHYISEYLGSEVTDPAGMNCSALVKCRYSYAILATHNYLSALYFSLARVYTTTNRVTNANGSLTLGSHTGLIEHEIGPVLSGYELDKIGSQSGWTYGPVTKSCADVKVGTRLVLCSMQASGMHSGFSDFGAPVLDYTGYTAPYHRFSLEGMVFYVDTYLGGGAWKYTWFSPMSGIETDLGALTTH